MKKIIIAVTSIFAAACFAQAESADRHGLTAPAPVVKQVCPAQAQACPAKQSTVATAAIAKSASFTTVRGKNFVAFGGKGLVNSAGSDKSLGGGALVEVNLNVFKSEGDIWGVDVAIPLQYDYLSLDASSDIHDFNFPIAFRPYYRFNPAKNWVITPFADCGVGGLYSYYKGDIVSNDQDLCFTWQLGAGVEISFYQDFSFTPKYKYFRIENAPFTYYQSVGAEFSWKFASNMVASIEYGHEFWQQAKVDADWGMLKVRYEF